MAPAYSHRQMRMFSSSAGIPEGHKAGLELCLARLQLRAARHEPVPAASPHHGRIPRLGEPMTQSGEPAFDKREQLEQIRSGLMDGEQIYAVYDATGAGTGFIAATDKRVILQDKSFAGKKVALVSLPYSRITSVAVTSNRSLMGNFFSSSSIAITAGTATTRWSSEDRKRLTTCTT